MTSIYGADVAELRTLASFLDQNAERLQVLSGTSDDASNPHVLGVARTPIGSAPTGRATSRVRCGRLPSDLRDSAQALRRNADEQENASGAEAAGARAASGAATAIGSTPLPDPRDLTLNGVNLWDLAKLGAGNVGAH